MNPRTRLFGIVLLLLLGSTVGVWAQVLVDFENITLEDLFLPVDEDGKNLGDVGPSSWIIQNSANLDGKAVTQSSNIWGGPGDEQLMGTFLLYQAQEFQDFVAEVDVSANDNDGVGIVWAYKDLGHHYRIMMINDGWPDVPIDGEKGPMCIAHKRISNTAPWYSDPLAVIHAPDYINYPESGLRMHWTLEVTGGKFLFTSDHGIELEGEDTEYQEGMIGFQLYAESGVGFDNLQITDTYPVHPAGKLAATWGWVKQ